MVQMRLSRQILLVTLFYNRRQPYGEMRPSDHAEAPPGGVWSLRGVAHTSCAEVPGQPLLQAGQQVLSERDENQPKRPRATKVARKDGTGRLTGVVAMGWGIALTTTRRPRRPSFFSMHLQFRRPSFVSMNSSFMRPTSPNTILSSTRGEK